MAGGNLRILERRHQHHRHIRAQDLTTRGRGRPQRHNAAVQG